MAIGAYATERNGDLLVDPRRLIRLISTHQQIPLTQIPRLHVIWTNGHPAIDIGDTRIAYIWSRHLPRDWDSNRYDLRRCTSRELSDFTAHWPPGAPYVPGADHWIIEVAE